MQDVSEIQVQTSPECGVGQIKKFHGWKKKVRKSFVFVILKLDGLSSLEPEGNMCQVLWFLIS